MTASSIKGAIKGTLKGILNTAAPVFSRRSAMDSASARETLLGFSPPPTGTAAADNRLLEPECDLQIVIPAYNVEADKCIAGAPDNSFKEEPIQLAVTAGIGINYKINDRLAVFAEPGVSHHFKTDSKLATVRTKRPTNFNLLCGLRMTY